MRERDAPAGWWDGTSAGSPRSVTKTWFDALPSSSRMSRALLTGTSYTQMLWMGVRTKAAHPVGCENSILSG
jgi:hypothetical protein